jgi:putative intracellular protease/amidase
LAGAELTGFSNAEEAQTPYNDFVNILPFSLEDRLAAVGKYVKAEQDWGVKVVYDKGILTGKWWFGLGVVSVAHGHKYARKMLTMSRPKPIFCQGHWREAP